MSGLAVLGFASLLPYKKPIMFSCAVVSVGTTLFLLATCAGMGLDKDSISNVPFNVATADLPAMILASDPSAYLKVYVGLRALVREAYVGGVKQSDLLEFNSAQCDAQESYLEIYCDMCTSMGIPAILFIVTAIVMSVLTVICLVLRSFTDSPKLKIMSFISCIATLVLMAISVYLWHLGCVSELPDSFGIPTEQSTVVEISLNYSLGVAEVLVIVASLFTILVLLGTASMPVYERGQQRQYLVAPGINSSYPQQHQQGGARVLQATVVAVGPPPTALATTTAAATTQPHIEPQPVQPVQPNVGYQPPAPVNPQP